MTSKHSKAFAPILGPYPKMKDSGLKSMGEVPAHWSLRRLGSCCDLRVSNVDKHRKDDEIPVRLCNYVDVYKNDRVTAGLDFMRATATAEEIARFRLQVGDVLITKDSETWNDIGVPALVDESAADIVSGYHLALLRPIEECLDGRWLFRALQSPAVGHQWHVKASGVTRFGLTHDAIKSIWVCLPPLTEQFAIGRYLDHTDRLIRHQIRAKEELVALLEEQKLAIVHETVSGQIDVGTGKPYPAYKDSGVEWLGMVPEHWVVAALRHRYQQCLGKMLDTKRISRDHLHPYLRNVDVQWGEINVADLPMINIRPAEIDRYTVRSGDLLVCEGGEAGRCAIWRGENGAYGYQKALHRLRPHHADEDRPRFMYYALMCAVGRDAFNDGHESTIRHLTGDKLRAHRFPFPPSHEQLRIEKFLDKQMTSIECAMSVERCLIDLLGEYRTRLITDVVTGKLDVREAASQLPDGIEEPGPPSESDTSFAIDKETPNA